MIILLCGLIGAGLGIRGARRRNGVRADQAQWAAACGIAGCLAGLILSLAVGAIV